MEKYEVSVQRAIDGVCVANMHGSSVIHIEECQRQRISLRSAVRLKLSRFNYKHVLDCDAMMAAAPMPTSNSLWLWIYEYLHDEHNRLSMRMQKPQVGKIASDIWFLFCCFDCLLQEMKTTVCVYYGDERRTNEKTIFSWINWYERNGFAEDEK